MLQRQQRHTLAHLLAVALQLAHLRARLLMVASTFTFQIAAIVQLVGDSLMTTRLQAVVAVTMPRQ